MPVPAGEKLGAVASVKLKIPDQSERDVLGGSVDIAANGFVRIFAFKVAGNSQAKFLVDYWVWCKVDEEFEFTTNRFVKKLEIIFEINGRAK